MIQISYSEMLWWSLVKKKSDFFFCSMGYKGFQKSKFWTLVWLKGTDPSQIFHSGQSLLKTQWLSISWITFCPLIYLTLAFGKVHSPETALKKKSLNKYKAVKGFIVCFRLFVLAPGVSYHLITTSSLN